MDDWKTLSRRELLRASPWVEVAVEEVQLPSGRVVHDFYQVTLPDFAVVVPQTAAGDIITVHQYKHGVKRVSTMLPAGVMQAGEDPLHCAQRELREETGYASDRWQRLGSFVVDGNRGCGRAHLFFAAEARRVSEPVADEMEPLEVRLASPDSILQAVRDGDVAGLAHVAALMLALGTGMVARA